MTREGWVTFVAFALSRIELENALQVGTAEPRVRLSGGLTAARGLVHVAARYVRLGRAAAELVGVFPMDVDALEEVVRQLVEVFHRLHVERQERRLPPKILQRTHRRHIPAQRLKVVGNEHPSTSRRRRKRSHAGVCECTRQGPGPRASLWRAQTRRLR